MREQTRERSLAVTMAIVEIALLSPEASCGRKIPSYSGTLPKTRCVPRIFEACSQTMSTIAGQVWTSFLRGCELVAIVSARFP